MRTKRDAKGETGKRKRGSENGEKLGWRGARNLHRGKRVDRVRVQTFSACVLFACAWKIRIAREKKTKRESRQRIYETMIGVITGRKNRKFS